MTVAVILSLENKEKYYKGSQRESTEKKTLTGMNVHASSSNTLSLWYRVHCSLQGDEAKTGNSYPNDLLSQGNQGSLSSRVCRSQFFFCS